MLRMRDRSTKGLNNLNLSGYDVKEWSNSFHTSVSIHWTSLILALACLTTHEPQASSISKKGSTSAGRRGTRGALVVNDTRFGLT